MIAYLAQSALALLMIVSPGVWGKAMIDVGGGQHFDAPVPDGFGALGDADLSFRAFLGRANPPGTRLIEVFLTPEDFTALRSGRNPPRNRLITLDLMGSGQGDSWSEADFQKYVRVIRNMDKSHPARVSNAIHDFYLNKKDSEPSLPDAGAPEYLGLVVDQPNAVGVVRGVAVDSPRGMERQIFANIYIYAKGRMFICNLNAHVHDDTDVQWLQETAKIWTERFLAVNN